jgi:hypothetical protein
MKPLKTWTFILEGVFGRGREDLILNKYPLEGKMKKRMVKFLS